MTEREWRRRAAFGFLAASVGCVAFYFAWGEPYPSLIGPGFPGFIQGEVPRQCLVVTRGGVKTLESVTQPFPAWSAKETQQYFLKAFPLVVFDGTRADFSAGRLGRNMHVLRTPRAMEGGAFLCAAAKAEAIEVRWGACRAVDEASRTQLACGSAP